MSHYPKKRSGMDIYFSKDAARINQNIRVASEGRHLSEVGGKNRTLTRQQFCKLVHTRRKRSCLKSAALQQKMLLTDSEWRLFFL